MPDESEHKMDGLLKAWAKKRRQEAGQGFDLHPATRRLLLDEVARRFPKRTGETAPWWAIFTLSWARLAGGVGIIVILGVVAWAVSNLWTSRSGVGDLAMREAGAVRQGRPGQEERLINDTERKAMADEATSRRLAQPTATAEEVQVPKSAESRTDAKYKPAAAPAMNGVTAPAGRGNAAVAAPDFAPTAIPPTPARDTMVAGKISASETLLREQPRLAAPAPPSPARGAGGPALGELKNEILAATAPRPAGPEPAGQPRVASRIAPAAEGAVAGVPAKPEVTRGLFGTAERPAPATAPVAPVVADALKTQGPSDYYFVRLADDAGAAPSAARALVQERPDQDKDTVAGAKLALAKRSFGVLDRFEFRRSDSKVTFIDADGSVYEGALGVSGDSPADETVVTNAFSVTQRNRAIGGSGDKSRSMELDRSGGATGVYRSLSFQASGTNRTLQEAVLVSGVVQDLGAFEARLSEVKTRAFVANGTQPVGSVAGRPSSPATPPTVRLGAAGAAGQPASRSLADASGQAAATQATNGLLLQGSLRIGTNAQTPFRAMRMR